jgi:rfaE bifunctional protein nucleotidyltransferase chain/domain
MKTIWTNGCFDILHVGHIRMLKYAASLGDRLVVGIDSDSRVRQLKGPQRPINRAEDRAEMLLSIACVDEVVVFHDEKGMCDLIKANDAHTIVVGDDYKNRKVIGSDIVKDVTFFKKNDEYSTSSIISVLES